MYEDTTERHVLWPSDCRLESHVHVMDSLGFAVNSEYTEVNYYRALFYQAFRHSSRGYRISEILEKKVMRVDTVEEHLFCVKEESSSPTVIMKNFIAEICLHPNSTNMKNLNLLSKNYFILELHVYICCFFLS